MTAELRRRGLLVNHKRVARLMREDNLLQDAVLSAMRADLERGKRQD